MRGKLWWLAVLVGATHPALAAIAVGAAAAPITPDMGAYLAGYGRNRPATGIADPLYAKAVVVTDGRLAIALVTIDCIGLLHDDVLRIRERAVAMLAAEGIAAPLAAERIVVTSTHTHAGPDVAGLWGRHLFSSGRDEAYVDRLVEVAAAQVVAAARRVEPATMRATTVRTRLSWVENVSEPDLLDDRLSVVQFRRSTGDRATLATLTNFACHPTVLGPDNHLVSADYVRGFYEDMDAAASGVHLFLQGAIGGWVQPVQGDRSPELAAEYGITLARVARAALTSARWEPSPGLAFAHADVRLPLENFGFRLMLWLGVLNRALDDGAFRTQTAWFSIGGAQFVTHPGETSPAYSLASRALMAGESAEFVVGLGLDALGYILKPEYFEDEAPFPHADYLRSVSVGPETGPLLMDALEGIVPPGAPTTSRAR